MSTTPAVSVIVPVKGLSRAKSRLRSLAGIDTRGLALAFLLDTIEAARRARAVRGVFVVSNDPVVRTQAAALGCHIVDEGPVPGMNAAIRNGAERADRRLGAGACAALVADLPSLRPSDLDAALTEAATVAGSTYLTDTTGEGTTLLVAPSSSQLLPSFGTGSAARHHELGARALRTPAPTLRRDVDVLGDLDDAAAYGLGRRSAALYQHLSKAAVAEA
jgi:2-phospho-L-lactate guanylyltransferase